MSRALPLALALGLIAGCGDDGEPGGATLTELGKALDRGVFAYSQEHTSGDPLQVMAGQAKKMLIYFENTAQGMRYLKVAMDLSSLGFNAYAGEVTFEAGDRVTLHDAHLCHYSEQTSTQLHGDTLETIFSQMSGCAAPAAVNQSYTLKRETVRGREVVFDASGAVTWTKLYTKLPAGVDAATSALLGAYQLTGSYYCSAYTPATYLLLFATPSGGLRYTSLQESGTPFAGYGVEEGSFSAAGGALSFTPDYLGTCTSKSYLYPTEAPIFPLNLRTGGSACTSAQVPAAYTMTYKAAAAQCTQFTNELTLTNAKGSLPFMRGPLTFPATTGNGAHYLWGALTGI